MSLFSLKKGATMPAFGNGLVGPLPSQERKGLKKRSKKLHMLSLFFSQKRWHDVGICGQTSGAFCPLKKEKRLIKSYILFAHFFTFLSKKVARCRHLGMDQWGLRPSVEADRQQRATCPPYTPPTLVNFYAFFSPFFLSFFSPFLHFLYLCLSFVCLHFLLLLSNICQLFPIFQFPFFVPSCFFYFPVFFFFFNIFLIFFGTQATLENLLCFCFVFIFSYTQATLINFSFLFFPFPQLHWSLFLYTYW